MSFFSTKQHAQMVCVEGRIIRADGTVEELGKLAYWHKNPLRRLAWRVRQILCGRKPGRIINH